MTDAVDIADQNTNYATFGTASGSVRGGTFEKVDLTLSHRRVRKIRISKP